MYARTTTLHGNPAAVDQGIAYVRDEVMPLVQGMDGCIGLSMLADRDSGRCIITTAWASEEAMRASEAGVTDSRARAGEIAGADTPEVGRWEIAIMHRTRETGEGARTRVIWGNVDQGGTDRAVDAFRTSMLSRVEALPGFCGLSMLVDRSSDRCALAVTYADQQTMREADERAAALRRDADQEVGLHITEVAEFDLVLAHLRVPETV
jgi:heme-degrading monooxygenase HmoA